MRTTDHCLGLARGNLAIRELSSDEEERASALNEVGECLVMLMVGRDPACMEFSFLRGLEHVIPDAADKCLVIGVCHR